MAPGQRLIVGGDGQVRKREQQERNKAQAHPESPSESPGTERIALRLDDDGWRRREGQHDQRANAGGQPKAHVDEKHSPA